MSDLRPAEEVKMFPAEFGDYAVTVEGIKGIPMTLAIETLEDPESFIAEIVFHLTDLAWLEAALERRRRHEAVYGEDEATAILNEWPSEGQVAAKRLWVWSHFAA